MIQVYAVWAIYILIPISVLSVTLQTLPELGKVVTFF